MPIKGAGAARTIALTVLGWVLVLLGIAALVLPGPGLVLLFVGLLVLSQQYEWAERRVEPVKAAAFKAAEDGVRTWPRIIASCLGACTIMAFGVFWGIRPDPPSWWPVRGSWWLAGGWATGGTLIASGLFALGMIVWSYRRFRNTPGHVG